MPQIKLRTTDRQDLRAEFLAAADVADSTREEMYALFARAYDATDPDRFRTDLAAKRDVLLLREPTGRVAGFTTLAVFDDTQRGRPIRIVFSGDTLVDPAHWGSHVLNFAWIRHLAAIEAEAPGTALYWLLLSKGFRTYRYLSTFARHYVPGCAEPDDPALAALRDRLAQQLFESAYDADRGVVAHDPPRERLAPPLARLPRTGRAADVARQFAQRNPGYLRGEELVCLCPLELANMRPFAQRLYRKGVA